MAAIVDHPTSEQITAYAHGKLSEIDSAGVESHLADCEACSRLLQQQPEDSLARLVRPAERETAMEAATTPPAAVAIDATLPLAPSLDGFPAELASHPRYRLLRVLGQGGMGAVYLAEHLKMQRLVALKVINPALLNHLQALPRFEQEVRAAARLAHPNIVQAHDADVAGSLHFLVMEYVQGTDLAEHVKRQGALPVAAACDIVRQAALGLQHAHEQGMVHRDIKPHNLMLTPTGQVKILDFGLATLARDRERQGQGQLTGSGTVMGTADYIAPEQTRDARSIDIRADIYSLGCTLYQFLSGRVPFPEGSVVDKMVRHSLDAPSPLTTVKPGLPAGLVEVVEKMMAKEPADRYQTPGEVAQALEAFLGEKVQSVPPRRRWLMPVLALAGLAAVLLGVVVYRMQTDEGEVVVTAHSPDVEIVFSKNGKEITVLDTKTQKKITLPTGTYDVAIKDKPGELEVKTDRVVVSRGKETLVVIERPHKAAPATPSQVEALRHDPWPGVAVGAITFSPDSRHYLAVGLGSPDSSVRLIECATGKVVQVFTGLERCISALILPGTKQIVTTHENHTLRLSDVTTAKEIRRFTLPTGWNSVGDVTPDGKHVSYHHGGGTPEKPLYSIRVLDLADGREVFRVDPVQEKSILLSDWRFTLDGKHLATVDFTGPGKGVYRLFDWQKGKEEKAVRVDLGLDRFTWRGRDRTLLGLVGDPEAKRAALVTIDLDKGAIGSKVFLPGDYPGSSGTVFASSGRYLLTLHPELRQVRVRDTASGKLIFKDLIAQPSGFSLAAAPDGKTFAVGAWGGIHLYRLP